MPFFHELPSFSVHIIIMLKWLLLVNDQDNILTLNEIIVHIEKNLSQIFFDWLDNKQAYEATMIWLLKPRGSNA